MKRFSHIVVIAALAIGAQAAWSNEEATADTVDVAALGATSVEQSGAIQSPKAESMLEKLGYVGHDGFPSRGGPIDD